MRSDERVDLVELGRDQQHRPPLGLLLEDLAPDELDRADVEAPRRLCGEQQLRIGLELASEDQLLLIAARQRASRRLDAAGPDVELRDQPLGEFLHLPDEQHAPAAGELGVVVPPEHGVLPERHVEHEPLVVAILGDECHAGVADLLRAQRPRDRVRRATHHAPVERTQPHDRVGELPLPVALDACDPDDLARPHLEGESLEPAARTSSSRSTGSPISTCGFSSRKEHGPARPSSRRAWPCWSRPAWSHRPPRPGAAP